MIDDELSGKTVTVPGHVLVREVADELVILSLESEEYFGLNTVGTRMWLRLTSESTVEAAFAVLRQEYLVDQDVLAADLAELVTELVSRKLIELR